MLTRISSPGNYFNILLVTTRVLLHLQFISSRHRVLVFQNFRLENGSHCYGMWCLIDDPSESGDCFFMRYCLRPSILISWGLGKADSTFLRCNCRVDQSVHTIMLTRFKHWLKAKGYVCFLFRWVAAHTLKVTKWVGRVNPPLPCLLTARIEFT